MGIMGNRFVSDFSLEVSMMFVMQKLESERQKSAKLKTPKDLPWQRA
jgi:hypothetical protein